MKKVASLGLVLAMAINNSAFGYTYRKVETRGPGLYPETRTETYESYGENYRNRTNWSNSRDGQQATKQHNSSDIDFAAAMIVGMQMIEHVKNAKTPGGIACYGFGAVSLFFSIGALVGVKHAKSEHSAWIVGAGAGLVASVVGMVAGTIFETIGSAKKEEKLELIKAEAQAKAEAKAEAQEIANANRPNIILAPAPAVTLPPNNIHIHIEK